MYNILLIGAGQLGSRHLQGLAKSQNKLNIFIIEPSKRNTQIAIERFREIDGFTNHFINTFSNINNVSNKKFDIVIIATNADIRYQITKEIVNKYNIKYIVFEKVVFQSESQFEEVIHLLKSKNIKSWVNCPRRSIPYYHQLKEYLKSSDPLRLEIEGVEWGLACNSVHHLDLLAFLTNDANFAISQNLLENKVYQSKRSGFVEFNGSFSGESKTGQQFKISCLSKEHAEDEPFLIINLLTPKEKISINESIGIADYIKIGEDIPYKQEAFKMKFQSELTNIQIDQIIDLGESDLTNIEESFLIHIPFLKLLRDKYESINGESIIALPIT